LVDLLELYDDTQTCKVSTVITVYIVTSETLKLCFMGLS